MLCRPDSAAPGLISLGFNQDGTALAVSTNTGCCIVRTSDLVCTPLTGLDGGISQVSMLYQTNILALVGCSSSVFRGDTVTLWDAHRGVSFGRLPFRSEVKRVLLGPNRVYVALQHKVYVYNFSDAGLICHFETLDNPQGIFATSASVSRTVMAVPDTTVGFVRVEMQDIKTTTHVNACDGKEVGCVALDPSGALLAVADIMGTQIKVFDTSTGRLIQLFLRGATRVRVWSICFSHDSRLLAATSTHAHCHVFRLNDAALVRTTMWGVTSPRLVRPSVLGRRHASPRQPPLPATRGASGPAASGVAAAAAAGAGCSPDATAPPALTHVHHGSGSDDDEPHPGATAAASEVGDPAGDATGSTTAPPAASSSVVASHTHPSGPPRVPPQQHVVRGPKARRSSFISGLFKSRASGERAVVKCSVPANSKSVCSFGPHAGTVYPLIVASEDGSVRAFHVNASADQASSQAVAVWDVKSLGKN